MDAQLTQLEKYIISTWRKAALADFAANPLTEQETALCAEHGINIMEENNLTADAVPRAYGTTLIAAALFKKCWFALQIGDGKCVRLDSEGAPAFAVPEDERLGFGKTTSLCDGNAAEHFRHACGFESAEIRQSRTLGLTVATDGVTDSFIPDAYLDLHKQLYADFGRDREAAAAGIEKGVGVWSANGSRDDASLAGVFWYEDNEEKN